MGTGWSNIAVVATAIIAFLAADALGGSGLISAFVAGLAYGHVVHSDRAEKTDVVAENLGTALVQVSFLAFGALIVPLALEIVTWQMVVVAVLSLTVARMAAVAIAMIGNHLAWPTIAYLGWFGPRGLATIVFAALVVSDSDLDGISTITTVAVITVGLSIIAHGVSAYPGSQAYADWQDEHADADSMEQQPLRSSHQPRIRRAATLHDDNDDVSTDQDEESRSH
jgi:NhaP-type Na+/H+ or K+/H+ antiporter